MSGRPPKSSLSTDDMQTPGWAVRVVTPWIPRNWHIWECAEGRGNIVRALTEDGYAVKGSDIKSGTDFLSPMTEIPDCDCILTNPPFSKKTQWLKRCYQIGKPFALLLPLTALGEQERVQIFSERGISLIVPAERINYETPSGKQGGAWFYSAWFCHGLALPSQIVFSRLRNCEKTKISRGFSSRCASGAFDFGPPRGEGRRV